MKRILLAVTGTVLGLVALLSFKSHPQTASANGLPSAALPAESTSAAGAAPVPTTTTSAAPPAGGATSSAAPRPSAATARTIAGSAVQTRYGTVQVQITVAGKKIQSVSFLQLTGDDGRSNDINSQAGPILLQETLSAQNADIDTVSGATYTSQGYVQSLQSALDQAGIS